MGRKLGFGGYVENWGTDCGINKFLKNFVIFTKILKKHFFSQNFILFNTISNRKMWQKNVKNNFLNHSLTTLYVFFFPSYKL